MRIQKLKTLHNRNDKYPSVVLDVAIYQARRDRKNAKLGDIFVSINPDDHLFLYNVNIEYIGLLYGNDFDSFSKSVISVLECYEDYNIESFNEDFVEIDLDKVILNGTPFIQSYLTYIGDKYEELKRDVTSLENVSNFDLKSFKQKYAEFVRFNFTYQITE
ncbi:hypothetical protein MJH12_16760 [bacterium]|nr:hypothetical protein [bacterium]